MKQITVRLKQGELFKERILEIVKEHGIQAGVILAAVGGLEQVTFRTSKHADGTHPLIELDGPLEIVACQGTLSPDGCHIHISVSNREGQVYGGHLKDGARVFVTIELVLGVFDDVMYTRELDEATGFKELNIA